MKAAVLAAEDRDFYRHGALSYRSVARAAFANIVQRRVAQGGSTITQQYVKNAYANVGRERTIFRKLKEAIIAVKLEQKYSKECPKVSEKFARAASIFRKSRNRWTFRATMSYWPHMRR